MLNVVFGQGRDTNFRNFVMSRHGLEKLQLYLFRQNCLEKSSIFHVWKYYRAINVCVNLDGLARQTFPLIAFFISAEI